MLERLVRYPLSWRNLPSLLALIAAVLVALAPMAAIAATQTTVGNQIAQIPEPVDLAEARARTLKAEQELATREAAIHIEANLRADAYAQFQVIAGLFGILISAIVIFFSFQSQRVAGAAAAKAAREEMAETRAHIEQLRTRAIEAEEKAQQALTKAEAAASAAERERERAATAAAQMLDSIKQNTSTANNELTDAQRVQLVAAAPDDTHPEQQWSIDQFKTAIGKAMYVDENWAEAERLAIVLEHVHGDDANTRLYARNRRGDAALRLKRYGDALTAFEAAIAITTKTPREQHQADYIWAAHYIAFCLINIGRAVEAEAMLRDLLPVVESIYGSKASNTLATRYELARAILNQGRAAETETKLRALLPMIERIIGAEASNTLIAQNLFACAILDQGRSAEAETMLHTLLSTREKIDGVESPDTLFTRHELARAILDQDRAFEAEAMLRDLLPIREKVEGAQASVTLTTRYAWADAQVQSGNIAGAQAALAPIPDPVPNSDWLLRHEAGLAFVRGRVADAVRDHAAADALLALSDQIYTSIYPPDHWDRVKLAAYRANRSSGGADNA